MRLKWVRTGLLVRSAELAAVWECSPQALDLPVKHGLYLTAPPLTGGRGFSTDC